jgi:hypothetical protein
VSKTTATTKMANLGGLITDDKTKAIHEMTRNVTNKLISDLRSQISDF